MTDPAPPARRRLRAVLAAALLVLGVALGAGWWYRTTRPEYRLARAREALAAGRWDRAEEIAAKLAHAGHPDLARLLRGDMYLRRDRPAEALAEFNQITDQGAVRLEAAALSGQALLKLRELPEAYRAFDFVLTEQPDHADAHRGMAAVTYDLGQLNESLDHLKEVARLAPADGRPHQLTGHIFKDMGQHELAIAAYREALARDLAPAFRRDVLLELAESLAERTRHPEALAALEDRSPSGTRDDATALALRAECLLTLKRRDEAVALLESAPERYPGSAPVHRVRGRLDLERDRPADAVRFLERAVALDPSDYAARYLLSQAYVAAGMPAEAAAQARRVEQMRKDLDLITDLSKQAMERPWDPDVRERIAAVHDRMGRPELAAMWRQAAEICRAKKP